MSTPVSMESIPGVSLLMATTCSSRGKRRCHNSQQRTCVCSVVYVRGGTVFAFEVCMVSQVYEVTISIRDHEWECSSRSTVTKDVVWMTQPTPEWPERDPETGVVDDLSLDLNGGRRTRSNPHAWAHSRDALGARVAQP
jgi:hypothetical protein